MHPLSFSLLPAASLSLFLPLAIGWPAIATAQDAPDLCSDRPGASAPTCVAEPGTVQLETSFVDWFRGKQDGETTDSFLFGDSLIKFGVEGDTELRVGLGLHQFNRFEAAGQVFEDRGVGDVTLSARHRLVDGEAEEGASFAVQPFITLPTGSKQVSDGTWSAGIATPLDIPAADGWSFNLTPMIAAIADEDGDGRHLLYSGAIAVERALTRVLTATAELFAERDRDPAGHTSTLTANAMLALRTGVDTQFDLETHVGLSDTSPDIQLIVGFTQRLRR